jgi:L-2,4-diaminobutyrate decarboxylase
MHRQDAVNQALTEAIIEYAVDRMRLDPPPLDGSRTRSELEQLVGNTVTASGLGGPEALRVFTDVLAPACISVDHPRFLSFVPAAPTEASILFDLVVGASSVYAGSWLEGAGAVYAENQALAWIADLAGLPSSAGGVFLSGGTAGNLSALIAARWSWRQQSAGRHDRTRGLVLASSGAHSSVGQAGVAMDVDVIKVPADERGRLDAGALRDAMAAMDPIDRDRLFAVVVTCGTTNLGVIDDLEGTAELCAEFDVWMHVDGAYGGAGLAAPSVRDRYAGIEAADSFIVDPHKWLFAPFDCCALIYRDPQIAHGAHTQRAEYLEVLHHEDPADDDWNPSDYAHHLSRRARGLPLWFSLATHGTDAYRDAVESTLDMARTAARMIEAAPHTELVMEPELSIVLFRRRGWSAREYEAWSDAELARGRSFVVPTTWAGETLLRICIVNPLTGVDDIALVLASMHTEDLEPDEHGVG